MGKTLTANAFSIKSIKALQKELKEYRDSLQGKMERFIELLLKEGVTTACEKAVDIDGALGTHKMGTHVFFCSEPVQTSEGVVYGVMIGTGDDIVGEWYQNDGNGRYVPQKDTINALMALEFGTAAMALPPTEAFGVLGGRGTFPALFHEDDFSWKIVTKIDSKGNPVEWKTATAIQPTQPMYHAGLAMYQKVKQTAYAVFRS